MAPKTSPVWEFFTIISHVKARCDICKAILSYKGSSTSNLNKHLLKHPGAYRPPNKKRARGADDVVLMDNAESPPTTSAQSTLNIVTPTETSDISIRRGAPSLTGYFRRPMTAHQKKNTICWCSK